MGSLQELAEAESQQLAKWEERIEGLIQSKGGTVSAREFQRAVNVIFHDIEAASYDVLHREMWDSLQPVFCHLTEDVQAASSADFNWTLVDVGCGTGLATELLLRTNLRPRITQLKMIDTSSEMLSRCRARATAWRIPAEFIHGQIEMLPDACASVVVTCSVLHHIPNLVPFCQQVCRVLKPGGFYLHLQDPRRGATESKAANERAARFASIPKPPPSRVAAFIQWARKIARKLRHSLGIRSHYYLQEVNQRLIAAGLIREALSPNELFSITDLRLSEMPYSAADGVSADELAVALADFDCVAIRTYCFFGTMPSHLPPELAKEESRLLHESNGEGTYLAGAWKRRG